MADDGVGGRVIPLTREHGVDHGLGAHVKERRERVGELDDTNGADDTDKGVEVGDDSADHESEGPVDWNHDDPNDFAFLGGETGHVEDFDTDVIVDDCGGGLA